MLVHTVVFWLRPELTSTERETFAREGLDSLRGIPTVRALHLGRPAAIPPRPVVDASYDFSITVLFDDVPGHDIYQVHPVHLAFLARFKTSWTRVQIYDAA
jgi:Stress responsive A/B Barrel Domain